MPGPSFTAYLKDFGEETRRARHARGLSREKVARLAHIHENTISALERGERDLNCISQVRLLSALGCDALWISKEGISFSLESAPAPSDLLQLSEAHAANIVRIMGSFIRSRRKEMDLSLEEASREAGIHRNSLWNFELGLVAPHGYSVFTLFHALGLATAQADMLKRPCTPEQLNTSIRIPEARPLLILRDRSQ